ncbi:hypothetical protein N7510_003989 [Penicillium lagena]|uniref:uncharacterized protein n=1 Tax=Penicillium lagena TaxID=94218 RepID=UPI002540A575|nr:uncharacterized protein N7510_003989 [Penicillium lagena]KAJ5620005.1 hypothetical protein N7510_003989 [Penicillium lagena]
MASASPRIIGCELITDFVQRLLDTAHTDTHLIICGSRDGFLAQLSAVIQSQQAPNHELPSKTIAILAKSSKIQLAFCPSLESLRAHLAVLLSAQNDGRRLLAILDAVALHASTTEFSGQGLSRTFATAVEAASRTNSELRLCECCDAIDPTNTDCGRPLWDAHVPLLNGSVRIRGEERAWGGRGVTVRRVAQRWFEFD